MSSNSTKTLRFWSMNVRITNFSVIDHIAFRVIFGILSCIPGKACTLRIGESRSWLVNRNQVIWPLMLSENASKRPRKTFYRKKNIWAVWNEGKGRSKLLHPGITFLSRSFFQKVLDHVVFFTVDKRSARSKYFIQTALLQNEQRLKSESGKLCLILKGKWMWSTLIVS